MTTYNRQGHETQAMPVASDNPADIEFTALSPLGVVMSAEIERLRGKNALLQAHVWKLEAEAVEAQRVIIGQSATIAQQALDLQSALADVDDLRAQLKQNDNEFSEIQDFVTEINERLEDVLGEAAL